MRRFVKRMAAAVLLSACLVSLSGCSSNQDAETDSTISMDGTPVDDSMAQSIMLSAAQTLGVPKDQLIVQKTLAESTGDATTAAIYEAQLEVREDMGELKKVNMDEETDEICELCGSNMVIKYGRFGKFMACKNYPECKNTKPIVSKIGVKCPKCKEGDIIMRKSKKKKVFYGCSNYPDCDFVAWNKPVEEPCEVCGSYMYEKYSKSGTKIVCSNKECKHEKIIEQD
mgnify:CR=1 FL=1